MLIIYNSYGHRFILQQYNGRILSRGFRRCAMKKRVDGDHKSLPEFTVRRPSRRFQSCLLFKRLVFGTFEYYTVYGYSVTMIILSCDMPKTFCPQNKLMNKNRP